MNQPKVICVVGPTASGKTALAVALAEKFNGEIVSADSRQVYKKLDVGTGKDLSEYGKIKYHLIDICSPGEKFTLFDWLDLARDKIKQIQDRGGLPIIVGGTGLYVQGLVEGFQQTKNEKIKTYNHNAKSLKYSRKELDEKSLEELQEIYLKTIKAKSQIDLNNPRRIIRAIEIHQEGSGISKQKPDFSVLQMGISLPRQDLYDKIDKRVEQRFAKEKMLEEVSSLLESGVDPSWLLGLGLEYKIICQYLLEKKSSEKISFDKVKNTPDFQKMKQNLKYKIHGYARRQLTWFRRFNDIKWVRNKEDAEKTVSRFLLTDL